MQLLYLEKLTISEVPYISRFTVFHKKWQPCISVMTVKDFYGIFIICVLNNFESGVFINTDLSYITLGGCDLRRYNVEIMLVTLHQIITLEIQF